MMLVGELLEEIFTALADVEVSTNAVPETLTILRSFQFVAGSRDAVWRAMTRPK